MVETKRILVVDDEHSVRNTMKIFLKDAGYEVRTAESLEEAWELLAVHRFDVVLTDIIMPRFTGMHLLKAINETSLHAKIILMTGEPSIETSTEAIRNGAFDYLVKPFGKDQLLETVARAINVQAV